MGLKLELSLGLGLDMVRQYLPKAFRDESAAMNVHSVHTKLLSGFSNWLQLSIVKSLVPQYVSIERLLDLSSYPMG